MSRAAKLTEATLHAELGQIVAGQKAGRESEDETILFWHRGLSLSRYRARPRHAGKAAAPRHRATAALPLICRRTPMPIVNARMYSVTAECKADWHRVLGWALQRADLDWEIVDFDAPAPLAQLGRATISARR